MSHKARCPECGRRFQLKKPPRPGMLTACVGCHAQLEVVEVDPLILEVAEIEVHTEPRRPRRPLEEDD